MSKEFVSVAIDGPAGAGKSTIARRVAERLNFVYVDTGAIYRAVACWAEKNGVEPSDAPAMERLLPSVVLNMYWSEDGLQHMFLSGEDVTESIRRPEISRAASQVSAIPAVRAFLLEKQREVARTHNVIMDGRDIGTVVLPRAQVKIFLTASVETRARRRWLELREKKCTDSYEEVLRDIMERDWRDTHREVAPLCAAEDAVRVDTSAMSLEESVEALLKIIQEKAMA